MSEWTIYKENKDRTKVILEEKNYFFSGKKWHEANSSFIFRWIEKSEWEKEKEKKSEREKEKERENQPSCDSHVLLYSLYSLTLVEAGGPTGSPMHSVHLRLLEELRSLSHSWTKN